VRVSSERAARAWTLSRLATEYGAAQVASQALSLAAGLLVVNLLPVREYALYALALSVLSFLSVFSDLGLGGALVFFRREARKLHKDFAPYLLAALRMRRLLLLAGGAAGLALVLKLGHDRAFGVGQLLVVSALMIATVWSQIAGGIAVVALRLESRYRESYLVELAGNVTRLAVLGAVALSLAMRQAWGAMMAGLAGASVQAALALRRCGPQAGGTPARLPYNELLRYVLPSSASALYYAVQAPLVVWLSAAFSGTETIAEVGALGRLGAIMGLASGFIGAVLMPRLAAVTDDALYLRRYLQGWGALLAFSCGVLGVAFAAPDAFVWLLGDAYRHQTRGFEIVAVTAVLTTWGGYVVGVSNARGWVRHHARVVLAYAALQFALIVRLDLGSTEGVLMFGLYSAIAGLAMHLAINAIGFLRPGWVETRRPVPIGANACS
jgi:O-antigen/teichoic acid export membrane protein